MNRVLDVGYRLLLSGKEFTIKKVVGKGASSVTYLAECNQTEHLLKECNPLGLHMHREDNGALVSDTELNKAKFEEYLSRFVEGANKQLAFRLTDDLKNTTSNVQAIYHANGTVYIDMTYFIGDTYDNVEDYSLYNLLRRIKALVKVIGHYHDMGYLHLDVKPQNIYVIPETPEMVMMFDFDSVVLESEVEKIVFLSYTDSWAAPEQKMAKYSKYICRATDLFAIGEILFYKIFGRHSQDDNRFSFSEYQYDNENTMLKNVNPKVFSILTEIFHHTICNVASWRYQTAEELIEKLDEIIKFAHPQESFLKTSLPSISGFFIGRNYEIETIHNKLQQNDVLFLSGIGGIGKSELAKHYANEYKNEYDAIIFSPFVSDIQMMITDDNAVPIYNFSQYPEEKSHEYFERKLHELGKLCNERTLIIVDNLNITEDSNFDKLLKLGCKMLITTRVDFADFNQSQIKIDKLNNKADIRKIFDKYYNCQTNDESTCVDEIIELVDGHTLAVELIAKQIEAEWATADEILEKLKTTGVYGIGDAMVDSGKDNNFSVKSSYNHIKSLFDLSVFKKNVDALYILTNLALIPYTGIDKKLFAKWCELDKHGGKTNFDNLVKSGWIKSNEENAFVSLHPIVADVLLAEFERNISAPIIDFLYNASLAFYRFGKQKSHIIALNRAIINFEKYQNSTKVDLAKLHNALGILYKNDDLFSSAEKHYKIALSLAENQNLLISIYSNLINLYCSLDRFDDAEKIYVQSLDTCKEVYKGDNLHIATIYSLLGVIKQKRSNFEEAENYYKKALDIRVNCLGKTSGDVAYSHNDLGALYHAWGRFSEAEKEYDIALEIRLDLYGEKHKDTIISYTNLAVSLIAQNRFAEAEEKNNKVLKLCYDVYGNNHSETAVVLNNIGFIYGTKKQYELSEKYFKQALHIWEKKFNGIHTKIADAKLNLGVSYREQNRFDEAIQMLLQAKDMYITIHKDKMHSSLANVYSALGKTYAMNENIEAAYDYYQNALSIRRNFFDEGHQKIKIIKERIEELKK